MKTYWNTNNGLTKLNEWEPNCWIQVTCPTEEDQHELEERSAIPTSVRVMSTTTVGCSPSYVSLM